MQAEPRFGAAWIQDDPTGLVSKIAALVNIVSRTGRARD